MYTKTVFETPEEFIRACQRTRAEGDESVTIPYSVTLVFDGDTVRLSGEGSERFDLDPDITQESLINAAFTWAGISFHWT